jgi:hypothetical protein
VLHSQVQALGQRANCFAPSPSHGAGAGRGEEGDTIGSEDSAVGAGEADGGDAGASDPEAGCDGGFDDVIVGAHSFCCLFGAILPMPS